MMKQSNMFAIKYIQLSHVTGVPDKNKLAKNNLTNQKE